MNKEQLWEMALKMLDEVIEDTKLTIELINNK